MASRLAWATISTAPVRASRVTTVTSPPPLSKSRVIVRRRAPPAPPGPARRWWPRCSRRTRSAGSPWPPAPRSEEHTSELQSRPHLVCRLLLEKKKKNRHQPHHRHVKGKDV